mmetsp:Transcript_15833/g.52971  ORF Transcript_15833/g.52971 Transcript_15833/m.52971 type:complete len:111 (+) Transcript_15833:1243-1575(+)
MTQHDCIADIRSVGQSQMFESFMSLTLQACFQLLQQCAQPLQSISEPVQSQAAANVSILTSVFSDSPSLNGNFAFCFVWSHAQISKSLRTVLDPVPSSLVREYDVLLLRS